MKILPTPSYLQSWHSSVVSTNTMHWARCLILGIMNQLYLLVDAFRDWKYPSWGCHAEGSTWAWILLHQFGSKMQPKCSLSTSRDCPGNSDMHGVDTSIVRGCLIVTKRSSLSDSYPRSRQKCSVCKALSETSGTVIVPRPDPAQSASCDVRCGDTC